MEFLLAKYFGESIIFGKNFAEPFVFNVLPSVLLVDDMVCVRGQKNLLNLD